MNFLFGVWTEKLWEQKWLKSFLKFVEAAFYVSRMTLWEKFFIAKKFRFFLFSDSEHKTIVNLSEILRQGGEDWLLLVQMNLQRENI